MRAQDVIDVQAMSTPEVYVSTDVEPDGPIPGPHSMLSFASVALDVHGNELGHFARNLETLPEAHGHHSTMAWWAENQEAWALCRLSLVPPEQAMTEYVEWVQNLPGQPVFVAYPADFDLFFSCIGTCFELSIIARSVIRRPTSKLTQWHCSRSPIVRAPSAICPSIGFPNAPTPTWSWMMHASRDCCSSTCSKRTWLAQNNDLRFLFAHCHAR